MVWPIGQPPGKLYDWAMRSRNCWAEIGNSTGLWYDPVGSLHLAYYQDEWVALQELFTFFKKKKAGMFNCSTRTRYGKSLV
jgi:hypothetical protein